MKTKAQLRRGLWPDSPAQTHHHVGLTVEETGHAAALRGARGRTSARLVAKALG
jgi:hypothetical protein